MGILINLKMNKRRDETMGNQQLELNLTAIPGYEGKYGIMNTGKVFGYSRSKFLKPKLTRFGYYEVALSNQVQGKRNVKYTGIHRLMALTFLDNPNDLPQVNHKNGDKLDNRIENLEWCTAKDNIHHAWDNGLSKPSKPNLGKNMAGAKSKYRNVIYIGSKHGFKAIISRKINNNRFTKTRLFSINKHGYEQAELLAAQTVNEFIDTYPEFTDVPKLDLI